MPRFDHQINLKTGSDCFAAFIVAAFVAVLASGCVRKDVKSKASVPQQRVSQFHPIRIQYTSRWSLIRPFQDAQDRVVVGFIDNADGKSLVLKIERDVSREIVSDDMYYDALKQQMKEDDPGSQLIDEIDVAFHGATYRRMRFVMDNMRWKHQFCRTLLIRRTGDYFIACEFAYPIDSKADLALPPDSALLNDQLELFEG